MPDFKISTEQFFDRPLVQAKMGAKTRSALSRFGAFVRQRDRQSMRSRHGVSAPGTPPSVHQGALKQLTFFAYDDSTKSVVIGPAPYKRGAAAVIEAGGRQTAMLFGVTRIMQYKARPHTGPAFEKELAAGPAKLWKE
jgi:hypothetical protein